MPGRFIARARLTQVALEAKLGKEPFVLAAVVSGTSVGKGKKAWSGIAQ